MCFILDTEKERLAEIESEAVHFIKSRSAEGSDPGLCILSENDLKDIRNLIIYGRRAKVEVLKKETAYKTASSCGARLSEHGGTGDGIIGALAGVALRIDGNDGRYRGQLEGLTEGACISCAELLEHADIDRLAILTPGAELDSIEYTKNLPENILLIDKPKTINLNGSSVFLITSICGELDQPGIQYSNWTRQELKRF